MLHEEPGYMSADPFFIATIRTRKLSSRGDRRCRPKKNDYREKVLDRGEASIYVQLSLPNGIKGITLKLCGANEAQRSLRPNERIVRLLVHFRHFQNWCFLFLVPQIYEYIKTAL